MATTGPPPNPSLTVVRDGSRVKNRGGGGTKAKKKKMGGGGGDRN
jgi:hypothetical protein